MHSAARTRTTGSGRLPRKPAATLGWLGSLVCEDRSKVPELDDLGGDRARALELGLEEPVDAVEDGQPFLALENVNRMGEIRRQRPVVLLAMAYGIRCHLAGCDGEEPLAITPERQVELPFELSDVELGGFDLQRPQAVEIPLEVEEYVA